jgi:hypothetical protein
MKTMISNEARELFQKYQGKSSHIITDANLIGLPEPVKRYLRYTQIIGKESIRRVHLKQKGFFKMQEGQGWQPLVAEQYYTTNPPAFLWLGRIKPFPLLSITGRDQFVEGHGNMVIELLSLIPLANVHGPEVDQGELLRYFAEIAWFPTAWLSDCIQWEAIDAESVKATICYYDITASMVLYFNDKDQITHITAERYYQKQLEKWSGYFDEYQEVHGIWIPIKAEVMWNFKSGDFSYFRGEIIDIAYNEPLL